MSALSSIPAVSVSYTHYPEPNLFNEDLQKWSEEILEILEEIWDLAPTMTQAATGRSQRKSRSVFYYDLNETKNLFHFVFYCPLYI